MRTIRNTLRKILFGRAFGGLEWHQVATLRDRLVKRSRATPDKEDDLPGIEYLGWLLSKRSLGRALALSVSGAFLAAAVSQASGGNLGRWGWAAAASTLFATLWATLAVRHSFLAEAKKLAPIGGHQETRNSLARAEAATRHLRRQTPLCFWTLVMRGDASDIVHRQMKACEHVRDAQRLIFGARQHAQPFAEPATEHLKRLETGCAKLWPDVERTLRLFDPGPLEAPGENAIIEEAAESAGCLATG